MTLGVMAFAVLTGLDRTWSNMVQILSHLVDRLQDHKKRHISVPIRVRMMGDNGSPVDASLLDFLKGFGFSVCWKPTLFFRGGTD